MSSLMRVRPLVLLAVLAALVSCKRSKPPARWGPPRTVQPAGPPVQPTAAVPTATAPTATAQPTAAPSTAPPPPRTENEKLVMVARPTLSVSTLQDDLVLAVSIRGEHGYLTRTHPLYDAHFDLAKVRFELEIAGAQNVTLAATGLPAQEVELGLQTSMALQVRADGVALVPWMNPATETPPTPSVAAWEKKPAKAPLSDAGKYDATLKIVLPLSTGERVVETKLKLERRVRGRSTTTVDAIAKIAKATALIHLNKTGRVADKDKLSPTLVPVDLPSDKNHRLVRYWLPSKEKWHVAFIEVVVERNGTVVKVNEQKRFTCVAESSLVDTESGPVAIEDLRAGDRVWSWDDTREERVLSSVLALSPPREAPTMLVGGALRVTAMHPVFADGGWVRADHLSAGAALRSPGGPFALTSVVRDNVVRNVYDMMVTWPHNFYANGVLVHNKRFRLPESRLDPTVVLWERAKGEFDLLKPNVTPAAP